METQSPVSLRRESQCFRHDRGNSRFPPLQSVSLLLLGMLALMIGSSLHKKLAYDEYPNAYYGYRFMTEGPGAVPDGQRMPVLVLNALGCASYQCDPALLERRPAARLIVRFPSFVFALLLGAAIYAWTRELYGSRPALLSLALYALNPNFIAHGKQVTSDLATCLFFFLSIYFFWRYSRTQKRADFFLSAFSTAAAIVSKYSGILIFGVLLLLWSFRKIQGRRKGNKTGFAGLLKSSAVGLGFCLIVIFLVNSAYLFKGSFTKTNEIAWQSKGYQKLKQYSIPIPFPKTFVLGMDYTKFIQENPSIGRGNNYILGKRHRRGRWYSFPLMILLKTPVTFFVLLFLAAFAKKPSGEEAAPEGSSLYLFVPFLLWLILFSTLCDIQLGVRYVLPAFVFLIVFAGKAVRGTPGPKTLFLAGLLMGGYALSSLSYYPHFISYFNEFIGSRMNAYRYLSDSNLDWEDKSWWIDRFIQKHPELQAKVTDGRTPEPGFLIVGANDYTGVMDEASTSWLRKFEPVTAIAYSHYLFYISPERLKQVLENPSAP